MSDLAIIREIEASLGFELNHLDDIIGSKKGYTLDAGGYVVGLSLYRIELKYIEPILVLLVELNHLKLLDLVRIQITDIEFVTQLTKLQSLNLGSNQISDIGPLKHLPQLQSLCLSNNCIEDITALGYLTKLEALNLYMNQIKDISPLKPLLGLQTVYLSSNSIEILPSWITQFDTEIAFEPNSTEHLFNLYDNPLKTPPAEIVKQGNFAVHHYFSICQRSGESTMRTVKQEASLTEQQLSVIEVGKS